MELILIQDVNKVGQKGDVVRVRDGFARNFLIPRKLALPATRNNQEFVEEQKKRSQARKEKEKQVAQETADRMAQIKVVVEARAGDQDKLFGSVTNEDIQAVLAGQGFQIDKKQIHIKDAIRSLGTHTVSIEVYHGVRTNIVVDVVRKS